MIEHIWTVACNHAVIDKETNALSLQDVIEQVTIRDTPRPDGVLGLSMNVATLWERSDPKLQCRGRTRLAFCSPSGMPYGTAESQIDLFNSTRHRTIWSIRGLPAREPGRHTFRIELQNDGETEWRQVAAIPLEIIFAPQQTEQPLGQSQ